jgi:antirestriction protein ArdC
MASPYNPTTGNRYRGVNVLALIVRQHADPRWMTYKQAQAQGWQVRAGEKGTQIQHWIWEEARPRLGKDGKPELDNAGKPIKDMVRLSRPKVLVAAVFNAEQIDGIPDLEPAREVGWDPLEKAERLLGASRAKIQHSQGGGAFYRLSTDTIHLPSREQFGKAAGYYAVALHELGHWTGHPDRLNRDLAHPFGSEGYAREELRAEIASLILGSEVGLGYDPFDGRTKGEGDDRLQRFGVGKRTPGQATVRGGGLACAATGSETNRRNRERRARVLVLPAVELRAGEKLETVVALQYRVEGKDNGLKSKFEIK